MEKTKINSNTIRDFNDDWDLFHKLREYKLIKSFINLLKEYEIGFQIRFKKEEENYFFISFEDLEQNHIMGCGFDKTKQNIEYFKNLKEYKNETNK